MQAYRVEATVQDDGTVTVAGLPFGAGERVEVIVLPVLSPSNAPENRYPFRGLPYRYERPFDPATDPEDWEAKR